MTNPHNDSDWLDAAARLAARARPLSRPNPGVGAILVRNGTVVGRGWTQPGGRPHAEAMALEAAGAAAKGATLYTTLEPCAHVSPRGPACSALVCASGIARLVYAVEDPDPRTAGKGHAAAEQAGIEVVRLENAAARASLAGYLARQLLGRPHVTLKLALSLDGAIALANGESRWITGEAARTHVHSRRAQADAILVGGATWRSDRPRLDARLAGLEARSPQRIVLTRGTKPEGAVAIDTPERISDLTDVQYLYVEGGAATASAFLAGDLVDRVELYRAPLLLGGGKHAVADLGLTALAAAHGRWHLADRRQLGPDLFEAWDRIRGI